MADELLEENVPGGEQPAGEDADMLDAEIEEMKRRVAEMEDQLDASKGAAADATSTPGRGDMTLTKEGASGLGGEESAVRSVYVGQVDYSTTPQELHDHFSSCGAVTRVTILCDKISGHPKGFAYVEFETEEAVDKAVQFHDTEFKGRKLKVLPKRENQPGKGKGKGRKGGKGKGSWYGGGYGSGWYSPYGSKGKGKKGKWKRSWW
eukprot:Hpha_TRINITY_DN16297_c1_g1::TRINITY_DN16297_c1_g1_i1::g.15696::m.15696/K14396/PABPN1, PABP2; polyadenylate-binding protein 2